MTPEEEAGKIENEAETVEKGESRSEMLGEEEKAGQILRKLNEAAREISKDEDKQKEADIEERKERVVQAWVSRVMATGDNYKEAEKIINDARKKYITKYPGIVDEIHDRWIEQRNKGMY